MPDRLLDAGRDLLLGTACVVCATPGRVLCHTCEAALPRHGRLCWPTPTPPGLVPPFAAGAYDGALKALVNQHKEHAVFALAVPLGRVLADVVHDLLGEPPPPRVLLAPVPSRGPVVRSRGHDPLLRVARVAAQRLRGHGVAAHVRSLLVTSGPVADQSTLGARARAANLAGSMRPRREGGPDGVPVVVVDDVLTTGATAREAQRALEEAGHGVVGIATVAATRKRQDSGRSLPFTPPDV